MVACFYGLRALRSGSAGSCWGLLRCAEECCAEPVKGIIYNFFYTFFDFHEIVLKVVAACDWEHT